MIHSQKGNFELRQALVLVAKDHAGVGTDIWGAGKSNTKEQIELLLP